MDSERYYERETTDRGAVEVFDRAPDGLYFVRVIPNGEAGHTYARGEHGAPDSNEPGKLMEWGLERLGVAPA